MNYLQNIGKNNHIKEEIEVETKMKQKIVKKGYKKENRGITLVALVVTIVVLLILAGITITALFSENGIIKKAQEAKNATEQDQTNTQEGLANLADQMAVQLGEDVSELAKFIKSDESKEVLSKEQGNKILKDKSGKQIIIPVGFKIAEDSATEIDKGVVIEDTNKNQFVWVPVPDDKFNAMFDTTNNVGKLYDIKTSTSFDSLNPMSSSNKEPNVLTDTTNGDAVTGDDTKGIAQLKNVVGIIGDTDATVLANWQTELQTKFDEMKLSVQTYKGFYIGRYETSGLNSSSVAGATPTVKRGEEPSKSINWYYTYAELKNIEKQNKENGNVNDDVITSMIWGCQWDRTLIWLVESENKTFEQLKDSTSWGNYDGTTFNYTPKGSTTSTQKTGYKLIPTGSTEYTNSNNIYDLAGNLMEWTIEASGTINRVSRGGCYSTSGSSGPASSRYIRRSFLQQRQHQFQVHTLCKIAVAWTKSL